MIIREAISEINKKGRKFLANKDAETLRILEHVLKLNETGILASLDQPITKAQQEELGHVLTRLADDEPLEYILGVCDFYARRFYVSPATLIPRVETETLVDLTVGYIHEKLFCEDSSSKHFLGKRRLKVADIGTGSGCIIVSIALCLREHADLYASDISKEALAIARKNASAHGVSSNITFSRGDLFQPIDPDMQFDIIVANLPYVPHQQLPHLAGSVRRYEPSEALDGGQDGTAVIGQMLKASTTRINPGGVILFEIDPDSADTVLNMARSAFPSATVTIFPDVFQVQRFAVVETA